MKPGLTGLAQVMGAYATKPDVKLRYDLGYLFHWNPVLDLFVLGLAVWLLANTDSLTSRLCLALGVLAMFSLSAPAVRSHLRAIGLFLVLVVLPLAAVLAGSQAIPSLMESFGRDTTLTGRTEIWGTVTGMVANPVIGTGFEAFWLGDRLAALWRVARLPQ